MKAGIFKLGEYKRLPSIVKLHRISSWLEIAGWKDGKQDKRARHRSVAVVQVGASGVVDGEACRWQTSSDAHRPGPLNSHLLGTSLCLSPFVKTSFQLDPVFDMVSLLMVVSEEDQTAMEEALKEAWTTILYPLGFF
jgi:hypothetical protein